MCCRKIYHQMKNEIAFLEAAWPAPKNIVAGTTLRQLGFSVGDYNALNIGKHVGDNSISVLQNR